MPLKEIQKQVDDWVKQYTIEYFKPLEILARLTEETGELARELNHRFGPKKKKATEEIKEVIEIVNLEVKHDELIGNLSRGMKQRVGIAKTLLHEPELLLLDEPASGLDPKARIDLRNLIKKLHSSGKTLIVSSHILTELSDFCDSFGLMEKGELVKSGNIEDIEFENQSREIRVQVLSDIEKAFSLIREIENVSETIIQNEIIYFSFGGTLEELSDINIFLVQKGIKVIAFYEKKKNIEDIFMKYSNNEVS